MSFCYAKAAGITGGLALSAFAVQSIPNQHFMFFAPVISLFSTAVLSSVSFLVRTVLS